MATRLADSNAWDAGRLPLVSDWSVGLIPICPRRYLDLQPPLHESMRLFDQSMTVLQLQDSIAPTGTEYHVLYNTDIALPYETHTQHSVCLPPDVRPASSLGRVGLRNLFSHLVSPPFPIMYNRILLLFL